MKTNKKIMVISVAVMAVIALTLGISFAAWDNPSGKTEHVTVIGSNADLAVKFTEDNDNKDKVLVPEGQIGLTIANTKKTAIKTLGKIDMTLNAEAEGSDLVVTYEISKIYTVPKDYADKTIAAISALSDAERDAAQIVDLKKNYTVEGNDNPRFVTGDTTIPDEAPVGTDLRINLLKSGGSNYKSGDEIPFEMVDGVPTIADLTLSMQFTRTASEDFVTMDEFLNREIIFEITFTVKAKTPVVAE